jgi:hypothetical protein
MIKLKENMNPVLTYNQIDLITKKKKRVRWTKEEHQIVQLFRHGRHCRDMQQN